MALNALNTAPTNTQVGDPRSGVGTDLAILSGSKLKTNTIAEQTSGSGVTISNNVTCSGTLTSTGAFAASSTSAFTGAITPTGGIAPQVGTAPTCFHSGGVAVAAVATGTDKTAVNTETYIVEVFVPVNTTLTGVSILHLATSTGNVQFSLADSAGTVITAAQTASTAAVASAAYQQVPFAVAYAAKGPAKYYILMQNSASNHFRAHAIGNFGANKKTGETYGTFTNVTPPTTFTADLGPICDVY